MTPAHLACVSHSTLPRDEADQALRDQRFRLLVQGVKDYAIFMLDPEGSIICWNTGGEALFGYQESDILGRSYDLIFTPEDVRDGQLERELEQALAGGFEGDRWRVRQDGSLFRAHVVTAAVRREGSRELLGYSQITRDVTERERLERQLRQSHRMEAVGTLVAGVAHDFNNLLTVINGYAEDMLTALPADNAARASAEQIAKAAERAATLIRQLLAFSRKQRLDPQELNLNDLLVDLDPQLRRLVGENVQVVTDLTGDLDNVEVDQRQLEQVLLNLAANARDAMPRGGRLTLRTANVELGSSTYSGPAGVGAGPYVMLSMSDTGIGMDGPTMARAFEPFFTTKEPGKGTGLGLSSAYGIVKQSGGHLDVDSWPGAGATFRIYLPGLTGASRERTIATEHSGVPRGQETVLFVENEASVRGLGERWLRQNGYTVLAAADDTEADEVAALHPEEIHLLVTDVALPTTNGPQLAERLRNLRPGMKVLYVSGYSETTLTRQDQLRPEMPFLQKPFAATALMMKVREVLDG